MGWPLSRVASMRVGNFVGAGEEKKAKDTSQLLISLTVAGEVLIVILIIMFSSNIARLFTQDEGTVQLVVHLAPLLAIHQIADGTQIICSGVFKAIGRQRVLAIFNIVAYWVVSLPIGVFLAFYLNYQLVGIWIGFIVAIGGEAIILLGMVHKIDWKDEINKARKMNNGGLLETDED